MIIAIGSAMAGPVALAQFQFQDLSATCGLDFPLSQHRPGAAVVDFDQDGWLDVCLFGGGSGAMRIYRNNHDGTFTDATDAVFPPDPYPVSMGLFGDLDNDGDADLVLARRYTTWKDVGLHIYRNHGGFFAHDVVEPDLARDGTSLGGIALSDLDKDGDLDIIFMHNGGFGGLGDVGGPGFLLRNDDGVFYDHTLGFGGNVGQNRRHWGVVAVDFNKDSWPDIHAAVDFNADFQARNDGAGGLIDVSVSSGVTNTGSDMGLAVGDPDNDGDFDIYSTNINGGVFYLNIGQGVFSNRAPARGCAVYQGTGWGTAFVDLDHDRDEDLVLVAKNSAGVIFRNTGGAFFQYVSEDTGAWLEGQTLVPFDLDRDGDIDLLAFGDEGLPRLYANQSPPAGTHWLRVKPIGRESNRDAVGAIVVVNAGGVKMTRAILAGYSFVSGPPMEAHFGLGSAMSVNVTVTWPSGVTARRTNVAVDQELVMVEPALVVDSNTENPVGEDTPP